MVKRQTKALSLVTAVKKQPKAPAAKARKDRKHKGDRKTTRNYGAEYKSRNAVTTEARKARIKTRELRKQQRNKRRKEVCNEAGKACIKARELRKQQRNKRRKEATKAVKGMKATKKGAKFMSKGAISEALATACEENPNIDVNMVTDKEADDDSEGPLGTPDPFNQNGNDQVDVGQPKAPEQGNPNVDANMVTEKEADDDSRGPCGTPDPFNQNGNDQVDAAEPKAPEQDSAVKEALLRLHCSPVQGESAASPADASTSLPFEQASATRQASGLKNADEVLAVLQTVREPIRVAMEEENGQQAMDSDGDGLIFYAARTRISAIPISPAKRIQVEPEAEHRQVWDEYSGSGGAAESSSSSRGLPTQLARNPTEIRQGVSSLDEQDVVPPYQSESLSHRREKILEPPGTTEVTGGHDLSEQAASSPACESAGLPTEPSNLPNGSCNNAGQAGIVDDMNVCHGLGEQSRAVVPPDEDPAPQIFGSFSFQTPAPKRSAVTPVDLQMSSPSFDEMGSTATASQDSTFYTSPNPQVDDIERFAQGLRTPPSQGSGNGASQGDETQRVAKYVQDIVSVMKREERLHMPSPSYMDHQVHFSVKMRAILVDGLMRVHQKYKLRCETLFLAVQLVDRYLSAQMTAQCHFQLVGVTALMIAAKFEEIYPPQIEDFVHVTAKAYSHDEFLAMEVCILNTLQFQICCPTAMHFFDTYQAVNGCTDTHRHLGQYLLELSLVDYKVLKYTPSHLTAAALMLSGDMLGITPSWTAAAAEHTHISCCMLKECARELRSLHNRSVPEHFVRAKYLSLEFITS